MSFALRTAPTDALLVAVILKKEGELPGAAPTENGVQGFVAGDCMVLVVRVKHRFAAGENQREVRVLRLGGNTPTPSVKMAEVYGWVSAWSL